MAVPNHPQGAAIFAKELLIRCLITLKRKETVEAGVVTSSRTSTQYHSNPLPPALPQQQTLNVLVNDEQHNKPPPVSDPAWVISIRDEFDKACQDDVATTRAKLCIYKVPHYLREGNDRSFVPQIVSIGPYHHEKKRLKSMDRHKWRSLKQILKRTKQDVNIYLNGLKEIEGRIRACYEGTIISFGSEAFLKMMLLDGCFILELFQGATDPEGFEKLGYARNDPIFSMRGSMHRIQRDLIMLENQLPLFVLDLLLGIQLGQPKQKGRASKLALTFFVPLIPTEDPLTMIRSWFPNFDPLLDQDSLHCLEVFHRGLILWPGPQPDPRIRMKRNRVADKRPQLQLIPSVTELREAGVEFKRCTADRIWDVKFKNGILKIPRLIIHGDTKSLFLNLIAFEQCHLDCSSDITSYVIFMDNLINSPEDVGYLRYCSIIEHCLGTDAKVADLFNCLCQEVVFVTPNSHLSTLSNEINNYFDDRWHKWRASLKHNYFNNPWAIISLFAAVILLLLTLAQTFYTVYGYYRPW